MPKTAKKKQSKVMTAEKLQKFLETESKETGRTQQDLLEEMFKGGFHLYVQEIDDQKEFLTVWKPSDAKTDSVGELRKLRNFEPVARCIEFIKSVILGGAIDIYIDDPEDESKKEIKEDLQEWIRSIHQDELTVSLYTLMSIMLDEALTVGSAGAEIIFKVPADFNAFAEQTGMAKIPIEGTQKKETSYPIFTLKDVTWKELEGIVQLRIQRDAITRLKLYRNPLTWEANYWTIDEVVPQMDDIEATARGQKSLTKTPINTRKFLPWQIFWLTVNRLNWDYKGQSVIEPVAEIAKILDRILSSVGEGIYRAGNKKYFIICGTEKRPWSKTYTRDTMQQVKEMGKKNWTTIPVPAGFDIKEIGGTVFEATDVVNYFMSLIAQGMHVPLEVIGDRYARGNQEKAYSVTFDEIERLKYEFKVAVEYQLLRRQVWCKHGEFKTKQGGKGTSIIYVPELKITSRGLFSPNDRLEKIFKALNVANPITSLVKLEMERDMAKIFGYDEVKLKTQKEAKDDIKEMEKIQKANLTKVGKEKLNPSGEKEQGQPQPLTKGRTVERLKGGVSRTTRGQSKPMGDTRISAEEKIGEVEEETLPVQRVQVDVNIKTQTEPQKVEITTKSEPQILKVEGEPLKTELSINLEQKELDMKMTNTINEINERQKKAEALIASLANETKKAKKREAESEISRLKDEIEERKAKYILMKAQMTEINQRMDQDKEKHKKDMEIREGIEKGLKGDE